MHRRIEAAGAEAAYFNVVDEYGGILEEQAQELEKQAKQLRERSAHLLKAAELKRARFQHLRRRGFVLLAETRGLPPPPEDARVFREGDRGEVMVVEWESAQKAATTAQTTEGLERVPDVS